MPPLDQNGDQLAIKNKLGEVVYERIHSIEVNPKSGVITFRHGPLENGTTVIANPTDNFEIE